MLTDEYQFFVQLIINFCMLLLVHVPGVDNLQTHLLILPIQLENTFQAILITDFTLQLGKEPSSYAIYTYKCGELTWPTGSADAPPDVGIGYQDASMENFQNLPVSADATSIACVNCLESVWSNVVYRLSHAHTLFEGFGGNEKQLKEAETMY